MGEMLGGMMGGGGGGGGSAISGLAGSMSASQQAKASAAAARAAESAAAQTSGSSIIPSHTNAAPQMDQAYLSAMDNDEQRRTYESMVSSLGSNGGGGSPYR